MVKYKKILALLALSASLFVGCNNPSTSNEVPEIKEVSEDVLNKTPGKTFVKNAQIGTSQEVEYSNMYVQWGVNANEEYVMRFAVAVKGEIDSLTYTRAAFNEEEAKSYSVTTIYKSILSGDDVTYYDGSDLTTNSETEFYWACFSIVFNKDSKYYVQPFDVTLLINDEVEVKKDEAVSLSSICDHCAVVGHNYTRVATLKATSTTKGKTLRYCSKCGLHEEELDYDHSNPGKIDAIPAGEDEHERNNIDIVRGLYGDAKVTFTYSNVMREDISNWAIGRIYFLRSDEGKWAVDTTEHVARVTPMPDGVYINENRFNMNKESKSWFDGTYTDHANNMDVRVTITRLGDYVNVVAEGICKNHENCTNKNEITFLYKQEKALNVVLAATRSDIELLSADIKINPEEKLEAPIVKAPTSDNKDETEKNIVYTHEFDKDVHSQKVTYKFNNVSTWDDNKYGHWRAYLWRTDKNNYPWDDVNNGSVLTKFYPVEDSYTDWNGMHRKCCLEADLEQGQNIWPVIPEGQESISFYELIRNSEVTMEMTKFGDVFFMKVTYANADYPGYYATRHFLGEFYDDSNVAFSLEQEESTISLTSVIVETL